MAQGCVSKTTSIRFTPEQKKLVEKLQKDTGIDNVGSLVKFALAELAKARGI